MPVDLVIDHSVIVNFFGNAGAFKKNVDEEYKQNQERYKFLKWAQGSFENFRVVPPGTGICHQVNLEYLSQTVWTGKDKVKIDGKEATYEVAYPDTLVGTDLHTTMVNGLAVLGWGVGGIEAEAAMLGQPLSMLLPEVIGFKLTGKLKEGMTATDLVLTVTQMLRKRGVVDASWSSRSGSRQCRPPTARPSATWRRNMARPAASSRSTPKRWPTSRPAAAERVALVENMPRRRACSAPGTAEPGSPIAHARSCLTSSRRSPGRSGRRIACAEDVEVDFAIAMVEKFKKDDEVGSACRSRAATFLGDGDVVIAAITSCTNTSNPYVMLGAGLLARNAAKKGQKFAGRHQLDAAILPVGRVGVACDDVDVQVDQPVLGNTKTRVEFGLHRAVVADRRLGDLDDQQDIGQARVRRGIEVGARTQQGDIGLGLVEEIEPDGVLRTNDGALAGTRDEVVKEPGDDCRVPGPATHLGHHLAVDELDAIVFAQDAGLAHLLVFVRGESPSSDFHDHGHRSPAILTTACGLRASRRTSEIGGHWPSVSPAIEFPVPSARKAVRRCFSGSRVTRRPSRPAGLRAVPSARP